ncbi:MAG: DUF4446 family protein [Candidatus Levyibacteriota bacterium]
MLANFASFGVIILGIWLLGITIFFWKLSKHYNGLTRGLSEKSMKAVLESLLKDSSAAKRDIEYLRAYCDKIEKEGKVHIQKVGLTRFNPFKDTGGDQSFILSLVDASDTGVIISGLYSRSGTRWYAKKVTGGKGVEHDLSEEEKTALKEAKSRS